MSGTVPSCMVTALPRAFLPYPSICVHSVSAYHMQLLWPSSGASRIAPYNCMGGWDGTH